MSSENLVSTPGWRLNEGFYQEQRLAALPFVRHGVSSRSQGNAKDPEQRRKICQVWKIQESQLVRAKQVHGDRVVCVDKDSGGKVFEGTDAFVTQEPGLVLSVMTADCQSVFLVDPVTHAIGLAHAGWRGTKAGIIPKTVQELQKLFGVLPKNLIAAIGPYIRPCCYEVGPEVAEQFPGCVQKTKSGQMVLDLGAAATAQLEEAGVLREHIAVSAVCTKEEAQCFSHRRGDKDEGRMISLLGIYG